MTKICKECNNSKELSDFGKHYAMKDGHLNICKACKSQYNAKYRVRHKDRIKNVKAEHTKATVAIRAEKKRKFKLERPDRIHEHNLWTTYRIRLIDYNRMLLAQGGVCAICKLPETAKHQNGRVRNLAVDHCKVSGKIRGLLCGNCNMGIGSLKHDNQRLLSAIDYLKKAGAA